MRTFVLRSLLVLVVLNSLNAWGADFNIQKVEIAPLSSGISFNTVVVGTGWVTAPTTEMIGRKSLNIYNPSETYNIYISGTSSSTTTIRTIAPQHSMTFGSASSLHIYVSANTVTTFQTSEIR